MLTIGLALALLIGVALGLMGGGGSILTVPIFVYVLGFGAKASIAMSLAVVGTVSLVGAFSHWRAGNMNFKVAFLFGGVAMAGTFLGAKLSVFFTGTAQLLLFAGVMLAAAATMFRQKKPGQGHAGETEAIDDNEMPQNLPYGLIVAEGIAVGVLTGLVGVGGGFLVVPALVVLGKVPMKKAVGISLLVIAMKSAAGFVGYLDQVSVDWGFLGAFTGLAIVGIFAGTHATKYISQAALKRAFAVFLVLMGATILYKNSAALLGESGEPETASVAAQNSGAELKAAGES